MFDTVSGLPLHPLLVHAAVVFVPLLILVTLGYALVPRLRPKLDWAIVLLAVAAPAAVFAARQSGLKFGQRLFGDRTWPASVMRHEAYAKKLFWFALVLGVLALLLVALIEGTRRGKLKVPAAVTMLVLVLAVASAVPAGIYVYLTGDSGATAVWNPGK